MADTKCKKNTWVTNNKTSEILLNEDLDNFRLINNWFYTNISKFIKQNKNCLGDIEDVPKSKILKQQEAYTESIRERVYGKFIERMKRDMISKNNAVFKSVNLYQSVYHELFPNSKQYDPQQAPENQEAKEQSQKQLFKQKVKQKISTTTYRPMSSTIGRSRQKYTHTYQNRFNRTNKFINSDLDIQYFQSTSINNIQHCDQDKKKAIQQISSTRQNRQRAKSYNIHQQQVFIQDGTLQNYNSVESKQNSKQNLYKFGLVNRCSRKIVKKTGLTQRVDLEEIQKQQIKNKILMVNSVLAVNLAKSQGYKPKSQYWNKYYL